MLSMSTLDAIITLAPAGGWLPRCTHCVIDFFSLLSRGRGVTAEFVFGDAFVGYF